jgi:hypothetical protein
MDMGQENQVNEVILTDLIRDQGCDVAKILSDDASDIEQMHAEEVRRSSDCIVYQVKFNSKNYLVKCFDRTQAALGKSWEREVSCQLALQKTGLIPSIVGHNREGLFLVSAWQEGKDLREVLNENNLTETAEAIGTWYRNFSGKIHLGKADTNWHDYLAKYANQGLDAKFSTFSKLFRKVKIDRLSIAKNDAHLSNFISDPDGKLIGIDFAEASLKPLGWDILLTARVLERLFPGKSDIYLPALMQGWTATEIKKPYDGFTKMVQIFAKRTASMKMD